MKMGGSKFKIVLEGPIGTTCAPGDAILGHVLLESTNEVHAEQVSITISGRCGTKMHVQHGDAYRQRTGHEQTGGHRNETTYRGEIDLFSHSLSLFKGPYTLRPTVYRWPFSITVPRDCREAKGDEFPHEDHYDVNRAQPPPPSFQSTNGDWTEEAKCSITYELKANLTAKGSILHMSDLEDKLPLTVLPAGHQRPFDSYMVKVPQTVTCRSYHLDAERESERLSFGEKVKSFFNSSDLPTAVFVLTMRLPNSVDIGQPIPMFIALNHDWAKSTASSLPTVRILELKASLNAWTGIRCDRYNNVYGYDYSKDPRAEWDEDQELAKLVEPIDLTKEEMGLARSFRVVVPNTNVPTFETFNITRQYKLKVKMTLECAEVKNKVEFEVPGFRVSSAIGPNLHQAMQATHSFQHEMKPPTLMHQPPGHGYNEKAGLPDGHGMNSSHASPYYDPLNQGRY